MPNHPRTAILVSAFAIVVGCQSSEPLPPASDSTGPPSNSVGGGGGFGADEDAGAPHCEANPDGSYCDCVDVPLFGDPPNLYFVLDRSGSMGVDDRWNQVRITVASILRALGPRANFGATVFPGFGNDMCSPPVEVLPISPGDPAGVNGPAAKRLLSATFGTPSGGTPTAEALRFVLPKLTATAGKSFVILATDGGPNCNEAASCDVDQCQPNIDDYPGCPSAGPTNCCMPPNGTPASCLDGAPTLQATAALASAGFPVYVIGIPGSDAYANLLDQLAVVGTTAQATSPKYYAVDAAGSKDLLGTLKKVAAKIVATCDYPLANTPANPSLVNVYLDDVVLPQDPVDGWKLEGSTVTLLGAACQRVLDGDVLGVRIVTGCPTVTPN